MSMLFRTPPAFHLLFTPPAAPPIRQASAKTVRKKNGISLLRALAFFPHTAIIYSNSSPKGRIKTDCKIKYKKRSKQKVDGT